MWLCKGKCKVTITVKGVNAMNEKEDKQMYKNREYN